MKKLIGILVTTIGVTSPLHAESYIGLSFGSAQMDIASSVPLVDNFNLQNWGPGNDCASLGTCTSSVEDTSGTLKLFGGYQPHPNFSVEAYYADLGSYSSTASDNQGVTSKLEGDITGLGISAVGLVPVSDKAHLFGKAGVFRWEADARSSTVDTVLLLSQSTAGSDSGTDPMFGIGGQFDLTQKFVLRVEYEHYATDTAIDLISIGAMLKF